MIFLDPKIDTVEDVLAIKAAVLAQIQAGRSNWSSEGTSFSNSPYDGVNLFELLAECRRFLKAARPDLHGRRTTQIIIAPQ